MIRDPFVVHPHGVQIYIISRRFPVDATEKQAKMKSFLAVDSTPRLRARPLHIVSTTKMHTTFGVVTEFSDLSSLVNLFFVCVLQLSRWQALKFRPFPSIKFWRWVDECTQHLEWVKFMLRLCESQLLTLGLLVFNF